MHRWYLALGKTSFTDSHIPKHLSTIILTPFKPRSFSQTRKFVQLSFLNLVADVDEFNKQLELKAQHDDIIICDPEAEYFPLVNRLNGQVVKISPTSSQYINPLDINLNYSEDENPLALKSDFILSLCEV